MKNLAAILLLACFSFLLIGYHLVFHIQQKEIKAEMKAFLKSNKDHKSIVAFSFTTLEAKSIQWEDENEFSIDGRMYDVIDLNNGDGKLSVRCIADKDETALIEQFRKDNERSRSTLSFLQLFTTACILPSTQELVQPVKIQTAFFSKPSPAICQQAASVFIPPPEV